MKLFQRLPILLFVSFCFLLSLGSVSSTADDTEIPIDGSPRSLAINPTTDQAVIGSVKPNEISVVDLDTEQIISNILVGKKALGVAVDSTRNLALVTQKPSHTLSIVSLSTHQILANISVGKSPLSVAVYERDSGLRLGLTANYKDNTVSVVDLNQFTVLQTIPVGQGPRDLAVDSNLGLALVVNENEDTISIIDLANFQVTRMIPVGNTPRAISLNSETHLAAVANTKGNSISIVNLIDWQTQTIPVDKKPVDLAMNPLDNTVLVVCEKTKSLLRIDLNTNTTLQEYPLNKKTRGVAVNPFTNTVTVVDGQTDGLTLIQLPNPRPSIQSLAPITILRGNQQTQLSILGSGFLKTSTVSIQPSLLTLPVSLINNHHLTVTLPQEIPAQAGTWEVVVANPAPEGGISHPAVFTVANPVPAITAIDPASTQSGGAELAVTVYGTGFFPETIVSVNGQNRSGSYSNGNEIKINLSSNDLAVGGTLSIAISNPSPGGGASKPMMFTVLNPVPALSSLNPNSAKAGSLDLTLNLIGNNFVTESSVQFNNIPVLATFVDSTHLVATIPAKAIATKGTYPVAVINPAPGGGFSGPVSFSVVPASNVNPLPAGAFGKPYEDLFPADATIPSYDPKRFSLITGLVTDKNNSPLSEVTIGIHNHPEYGTARTDTAGRFSLPLDGGGTLTVTYQKAGYLPAHRQVQIGWNAMANVEILVMIPEDTAASTLTFNGDFEAIFTHRSTPTIDSFGTRSLTMVFTGENRAWVKDNQGIEQPLTSITVRATEYPTPESMPAKLPPTSAFTYCAELSVDGAKTVRFEKPMVVYVNNFLGFNVGEIVPVGYYDRDRAVWVPQNNGKVVRLLDTNGDGVVDAYTTDGKNQYPAPGLNDPSQYPPDATFWRVEHNHFSPLDYNWVLGPEAGATPPPADSPLIQEGDPCPITSINSYVENKTCIFHEDMPVLGTDLVLHYATNRTAGYKSVVTIPVSGASVPSILRNIIAKMEVAGRVFRTTVPTLANKKVEFVWDGLDYLGRQVTGSIQATISVGYVYRGAYYSADSGYPQAFAQTGITMTRVLAREEAILWRHSTIILQRGIDTLADGWTLSSHHFMSPADPSLLYKGDGSTIKNNTRIITTIAGNGPAGFSGDGGPAIQAMLNSPGNVTVDKAGVIYLADTNNHRVRKVDRNGIITTIAGNYQWYASGDGGPAAQAGLGNPAAVAVDDTGNVYIAADHRIRKVNTSGIISTIAGTGQYGFSGDGNPATQARLYGPTSIALDSSGNLFIADQINCRIRKVDTNGIITTVAGNGQYAYSGDGGPANQAGLGSYPSGVAVDEAGNLYIASGERIRKVDTSGIITTVAGKGTPQGFSGDGGPATQALFNNSRGLSVDGLGTIFLSDRNNERIRKVNTSGIITTIAGNGIQGYGGDGGPATQGVLNYPEGVTVDSKGNIYIAEMFNNRIRKVSYPEAFSSIITSGDTAFSDEKGQGYIISSTGLHKSTIDLETGRTLLTFGYNPENQLISITDRFGNQTTIYRDGGGKPLSLTSPDGTVTRLTIDSNNHLTAVTYPDHSAYSFIYTSEGLMTDKYDPRNNRFRHVFNPNGLITDVFDPEGGRWSFSRSVDNSGTATVSMQTGEGNITTYQDRTDSTGAYTSITNSPFGLTSTFFRSSDSLIETEQPSCGMGQTMKYDLDPVFKYKYLKEFIRYSPSGLSHFTSDTRTYQNTNADTVPDRITKILSLNGKNWTTLHNTLTGILTGTSPMGRTITRTYDPMNLLPRNMTVTGLLPVSYGYDTRGRLTNITNGNRSSSIAYNLQGNIESVTTPDMKTVYYTYDPMGRIKSQILPDAGVIGYDYDANGNLTLLSNPRVVGYGFDYNGVNLRKTMAMPSSGNYLYTYDKERKLKSILFPTGKEVGNTYANGLLIATATPEGITSYTYTCGANLQEAARGQEKIAYTYDGSLLKTDIRTGLLNQIIGYGYNNDFRLTSLSYAGASQTLAYDNDGLLTGAGSFNITRNAENGLPVTVSGGTLINSRTFNGYGELDDSSYIVGGANRYSYSLSRDLAGRITQKVENVDGMIDTYDYGYDSNGRLNQVEKNSVIVESYSYDPNGNRLSEMNNRRGINRSYSVSDEDQVLTAGNETYQFDADGFLTTKTAPAGTMATSYSSRGELLSASLSSGIVITYDHDPVGRRIAKRVNGEITEKYLWKDAITLLAVYDASDNLLMRFSYADGRLPVSMTKNGLTYYFLYDNISSLKGVTDGSGNIVKKIDYDSFGNIVNDTNPAFAMPFGFAGGLQDRDTNFVHFGVRDYDPSLGRWTAKDPIDFSGGDTNLYGYVANDPVNLIDHLGLRWFKPQGAPDLFGRNNSWLEPGSPVSLFLEKYVPAMYETAFFHDWLVDTLTIRWGVPDLLANYPTMPFAFGVAFFSNYYGPGLTSIPNKNICK